MAEAVIQPAKAPWHLWAVGILSLLWDAVGAMDFTMTQTRNEAYMKAFTPEQLAYFYGFPLWAVVAWGTATWSGLAGSVLLLLRKRLAFPVYLVSLAGMVLTTIYSVGLSEGLKVMGGGVGMVVFNAIIYVTGLLLLLYARAMRKRGVLR